MPTLATIIAPWKSLSHNLKNLTMDKNQTQHQSLRIIYWNVRSFCKRREEIEILLKEADIFICVESLLTSKIAVRFPGFTTFRKDRSHSKGGGILILIRKDIAYKEIPNITSPNDTVELCGLCINNLNPSIDLYVCYRTPNHTLTQNQWDAIFQNINVNNQCIFVGDFNSHNIHWNCQFTDSNGNRLLNAIEACDLFLHNDSSKTYIDINRNYTSNLDLVFSSSNISDKMDVKVSDETRGSDHYPILINVDVQKYLYIKKTFKIKSVRTDWGKFNDELENNYTYFLSYEYDQLSPSEKYNRFVDKISESVKNCTPIKKSVNKNGKVLNPVPWWDPECDKLKRLRRALCKKWEFTKN